MGRPELSGDELIDALIAPVEPDFAGDVVVVREPPTATDSVRRARALERIGTLPCLIVAGPGWSPRTAAEPLVDVHAESDGALASILEAVDRTPVAALSLALHLRAVERRTVADGLVAESALFSALQAGPEHQTWRDATPARRRASVAPRVRVEREGVELRITLQRPEARNAVDAQLRDELLEALAIAVADPDVRVTLRGDGPVFCSGGDLDEFGTRPDPATAHLVRVQRSVGRVLADLADRTTVHVHGACAGSGVELAAFAGRVVADRAASLVLPEVAMGLVPGAGGTVSIPRRIGRHRAAWMALTGEPVDAATALAWGLVDEIQ